MCDYVRSVECATNDNAIKIKGRQIKSATNINKTYTQYKSCEFVTVAPRRTAFGCEKLCVCRMCICVQPKELGLRFSDVCLENMKSQQHKEHHKRMGNSCHLVLYFLLAVSQTVEKVK